MCKQRGPKDALLLPELRQMQGRFSQVSQGAQPFQDAVIRDLQPLELREGISVVLSHSVHSALLQQLQDTNTTLYQGEKIEAVV